MELKIIEPYRISGYKYYVLMKLDVTMSSEYEEPKCDKCAIKKPMTILRNNRLCICHKFSRRSFVETEDDSQYQCFRVIFAKIINGYEISSLFQSSYLRSYRMDKVIPRLYGWDRNKG